MVEIRIYSAQVRELVQNQNKLDKNQDHQMFIIIESFMTHSSNQPELILILNIGQCHNFLIVIDLFIPRYNFEMSIQVRSPTLVK